MKPFRIIPLLVVLLILVYLGVMFVEANQEQVILTIGTHQTNPTRLGFVVMTSVLLGIFAGAILATGQIALLFFQNRSLRKRINRTESIEVTPLPDPEKTDDPFNP
jgi:hypothetical protein